MNPWALLPCPLSFLCELHRSIKLNHYSSLFCLSAAWRASALATSVCTGRPRKEQKELTDQWVAAHVL
eukprot:7818247-Karenia_brevis.AAC.1